MAGVCRSDYIQEPVHKTCKESRFVQLIVLLASKNKSEVTGENKWESKLNFVNSHVVLVISDFSRRDAKYGSK